ncbi:MAG TPA: hypothetical protein VHZ25_17740 [Acidobacteriaceae bacterium]|nr:hypothetical protein [Acidobacteriaceae bacterium]
MINPTTAWTAANAKLAKKPIYIFAIGGQTTVYATHDLAKEGITGTLPAYEPWLKIMQGASQSIDVQSGTSSIGELQCEVVDVGGAVRTLVGTTTLEGSTATLTVGYPGLAYTDFVVLHIYTLYKIVPQTDYTSFLFSSRDVQMDAKRTIWDHPINGSPLSADNPWIIQGTPCEIIQAIWVLGLNNDVAQIDRATMVQLDSPAEGIYSSARPFRFEMVEPFQAKQFLQDQIFKAAGMYPVVTNTGQYSVRAYRPFAAGPAPVFAFSQDNVTVLPGYDRAPILNDLFWQLDADTQQNYSTSLLYLDATSISSFGRSNERQVQSDGLRTELGAQWFAQDISQRMFARFAGTTGLRGGAPLISVQAFFATLPVWVGDYVTLSHPQMPDLFSGALGVSNRIFEVIDRSPDYANGRMQYKLLDTGLTGAAPAARIGAAVIGTDVIY